MGTFNLFFSRSLARLAHLPRMALLVAVAALVAAPFAMAAPGGPSGDGTQPVETSGNPNCVTVLGLGAKEIKDDSPGDSTVSDGTLTVIYDVRNTPDGQVFDFTSSIGLDAVIVKAGDTSNVYTYAIENTADTSLHGPINSSNGRFYDLSHISFCYDAQTSTCSAPAVTTSPVDVTMTYGDGNAVFTASGSGSPAPTVKWQVSTDGGGPLGNWADIPGATTTTLTITDPTVAQSGNRYRAVFTNSCGSATSSEALLTVNRKAVTGTCTVADKVYDGTTAATITGSSLGAGVLAGDDVTLDTSGQSSAFGDPDVGSDKPVPCNGYALAGADAANYTLTMSNTTADITPKALVATCTVANRVYDGTTAATITGSSLSGAVAGDSVSLNGAGASSAFGDPNVGTGKPVPCNGYTLSGADAGNYTLTVNPTTANITPKPVVGACTAADKDFDGTTAATVTGTSVTGVIGAQNVGLGGGSATFNNPDPGVDKPVDCKNFVLTGTDKGNYILVSVADTDATIRRPPAPAPLPPEVEACLRRPVFAFIRGGKQTQRVVFFLDGKKYGDVRKPDSRRRFGVNVDRGKLGPGVHVLSATIYFTKASGRKPLKLIVVKLRPCLGGDAPEQISVTDSASCVRKAFLAFVRGDTISTVAYSLNGKRLRTLSVADGDGRYKIRIRPSMLRAGKNVLKARITFIKGSKTRAVTLKRTVRPCA